MTFGSLRRLRWGRQVPGATAVSLVSPSSTGYPRVSATPPPPRTPRLCRRLGSTTERWPQGIASGGGPRHASAHHRRGPHNTGDDLSRFGRITVAADDDQQMQFGWRSSSTDAKSWSRVTIRIHRGAAVGIVIDRQSQFWQTSVSPRGLRWPPALVGARHSRRRAR